MKDRHFQILVKLLSSLLLTVLFSCAEKKDTNTILVLATADHFGLYTKEILKTEGFNNFILDSIENKKFSKDFLQRFDIVILAQTDLTASQVETIVQYVNDGGNLIAFRPDRKLQTILGIKESKATIPFGYLRITDHDGIGKGLLKESLQIHSAADGYELAGGKEIALLCLDNQKSTAMPALVFHNYGKGHALTFTYNLPESVVYTRQGNPESAGLEKDGITGLRAMDLFTHGFVDTMKNTLNQADEQMRLLTHGIEQMSLYNKPIPRFWYFPDSLKCVVTLNNDGEDSKEAEFLAQFDDVENHGAAMTLYVKETGYISNDRVSSWVKRGFEISGHPNDTRQAAKPDWNTMDSVYTTLKHQLQSDFGISSMKTITNHWFVWVGNNVDGTPNFAAQAKIEERHGVGLDCNYAHYDNGSDQGHFLGEMGTRQGNYTGSGLSMKFANNDGQVIDVYQQLNNVYDQQYMEHKDQDGYFQAFQGLMDRSIRAEVYSTISVRAHNNEYFFSKVPLLKMLDYAKANNVPVWTELTWLEFLQAKDEASFDNIRWTGEQLTFSIHSKVSFKRDLACLIPYRYNGKKLIAIHKNGEKSKYTVVRIKDREYVSVLIKPGSDYEIEAMFGAAVHH